ncbi:hypothetical protein mRhiFer1_008070 [Rhinolophus ferrumequinum]|uniref:Uncharacterized protein n=1 Tax=Rhinolophus ferrumequinum TaxID=59479 RepID=A0A7J7WRD5_RHIFE|nr:hypothetical protein mRhiFer1_008070 [Rhinolophus ferrumequinum]
MPLLLLNFSNHPLLALKISLSGLVPGVFLMRSACKCKAFSQIMLSETLSPANCFSFIHMKSNFSTSSIVCVLCLVSVLTPLATLAPLMASLFFKMVEIVDFAIPNCVARSHTRTPLSCLEIISFFTSIVVLLMILLALQLLSISHSKG